MCDICARSHDNTSNRTFDLFNSCQTFKLSYIWIWTYIIILTCCLWMRSYRCLSLRLIYGLRPCRRQWVRFCLHNTKHIALDTHHKRTHCTCNVERCNRRRRWRCTRDAFYAFSSLWHIDDDARTIWCFSMNLTCNKYLHKEVKIYSQ